MGNRNISCKISRRCSLPYFTKRPRRVLANDAPPTPKILPSWLALARIVPHDREADADRKTFDGRDAASGGWASWRLPSPGGAEFCRERVSIFATINPCPGSDQMVGRASES